MEICYRRPSCSHSHCPQDEAARLLGAEGEREIQPTALDLEKMDADNIAFSEMIFGIPPVLFEQIKLCQSAKEIWDTLQDSLEGSDNVKEKRLTSVVNEYDTFTVAPGESVLSAANHFRICINNLTAHNVTRTSIEHNTKFINSLGRGWSNVKSCLQSNGSLRRLTIFQLFDELQGHESHVKQGLLELGIGGHALIGGYIPPIQQQTSWSAGPSQPDTYTHTSDEYVFDPEAETEDQAFQKEFAMLTVKYNRRPHPSMNRPPNRYQNSQPAPHNQAPNNPIPSEKSRYIPNIPSSSSNPPREKPVSETKNEIVCHKCGLGNHFARDCQSDRQPKPRVKDSAYYTKKAKDLADSEKAYVVTEGNVDGYWSSGDEKETPLGQNFCLMAREHVDCKDGYYSSGDEEEESDEDKKKNYCNMANNNPEGRSIIEQVRNLLLLNNCDTALCEPYLTKIETHLADALRAYQRAVED